MLQPEVIPDTIVSAVTASEPSADWTVWSLCADGCYMMIPIFIMLVIMLSVFFFRYAVVSNGARLDKLFIEKIKDLLHENEIESAENLCRKTATPASRVVWKGLSMLGMPIADICNSLRFTIEVEMGNLRKSIGWLRFIAVVSPLLGLLGALIGMAWIGYGSPSVSVSELLCGPSVTFACGIGVGILSIAAVEWLKAMINRAEITLNSVSVVFIGLLNEPAS